MKYCTKNKSSLDFKIETQNYLYHDFVKPPNLQWSAYLCSMRGGRMGVLWAAEEQEGIWHISLYVGLARGYRHSSLSSFLRWHLQCSRSPSHSIHHFTASAMQRVETDLFIGQFLILCLDSVPCKVRLSHLLQAMNWHVLQIWPSFTHSRYKIFRFQWHLHGIASLCQCHNRLVTL